MRRTPLDEKRGSLEGSEKISMKAVDKRDVAAGKWLKWGSRFVSGASNSKLRHYSEKLRLSLQGENLSCYFDVLGIGTECEILSPACLQSLPSLR